MIYTQQSNLPIILQVGDGIIYDIDHYLKRNNLVFDNPLIVSGKTFSFEFAKQIADKSGWPNYILEGNTFNDVESLKAFVGRYNIDLIISVGGGKVIDTVKRASYLTNINNLSVPTVISNDGLISPIAVIKNNKERTDSLPGMTPLGVIIDLGIIRRTPEKFIKAAMGDILANVSATNDWILAMDAKKERMNDIAFHLSKSAATALVNFKKIDINSNSFLRLLIQGLVSSGIAMSLAGTSRPCSGSEHLISHAIDHLALSSNVMHGTQVGSISVFILFLQNDLKEEYIEYAIATGTPLNFTSFIPDFSERILHDIIDKSRVMRPGRYTILDGMTNNQVYEKFQEFESYIETISGIRSSNAISKAL